MSPIHSSEQCPALSRYLKAHEAASKGPAVKGFRVTRFTAPNSFHAQHKCSSRGRVRLPGKSDKVVHLVTQADRDSWLERAPPARKRSVVKHRGL